MSIPASIFTAAMLFAAVTAPVARAQAPAPRFKVLVIAELVDPNNADSNEIHRPYVEAAKVWLARLAADSNFTVSYLESPNTITDATLASVDVIWQMNYPPFRWNATAKAALEKYLKGGRGGWLGDHHASLYGPAVTSETWPWFDDNLLGGINYENYVSHFASGVVRVEDRAHPVLKNVPASFPVSTEEWYTWDRSPRARVHVLASVDESTYAFIDSAQRGIRMGDHPVVWTNDRLAGRNLYVFMGHHPKLFANAAYTTLLTSSIMWLANKPASPSIFVNQVAYDLRGPKVALIQSDAALSRTATATVIDDATSVAQMTVRLTDAGTVEDWTPGKFYYRADFSALRRAGTYRVRATIGGAQVVSDAFAVGADALAKATIPSIVDYYFRQRATSAEEWAADSAVQVNDGSKTVDMRGGWADASGDISKYFSHLAYANFLSPQQSPMVAWELADSYERIPALLTANGAREGMQAEALWGADYLYRAMAPEGYFHMVVFSFFSKNANDRRVVGLLADSKTNNRWQASFRSGGGMAIAALARISRWKKNSPNFTAQNYLEAAEKAYAHLLVNNTAYDDDGRENIIDDYCALMASTELWIATDSALYRDEARKRMHNLAGRMTPAGYFRADDASRPFWHAADAGLPIVSLVRYLDKETDASSRAAALGTIRKALDYELSVTRRVGNPFGYARQNFLYDGVVTEGFFIPQINESGWWWQGENARLGSLAAAAILGGRLVYPADGGWGVKSELAQFAADQMAWIMGRNPFGVTFMHGFGRNNPPVITALFGHGTNKGGIANGVTGRKGSGDGSGIDWKTADGGNEWRWIEQWIPHAGWFLVAASAMAQPSVERARPNAHLPH